MALRRAKREGEEAGTDASWRVLVVNDEPDACELLVRLLSHAGHDVERNRDATELNERLMMGTPPDVIVLDVAAGGIGGNLKLLDTVRGSRVEKVAATPVVLVAAAASSAMFSWQAGIDEFLVRPFHADELVDAVAAAASRPAEERPRHRRVQMETARTGGRRRDVARPSG